MDKDNIREILSLKQEELKEAIAANYWGRAYQLQDEIEEIQTKIIRLNTAQ